LIASIRMAYSETSGARVGDVYLVDISKELPKGVFKFEGVNINHGLSPTCIHYSSFLRLILLRETTRHGPRGFYGGGALFHKNHLVYMPFIERNKFLYWKVSSKNKYTCIPYDAREYELSSLSIINSVHECSPSGNLAH